MKNFAPTIDDQSQTIRTDQAPRTTGAGRRMIEKEGIPADSIAPSKRIGDAPRIAGGNARGRQAISTTTKAGS